MSKYVNLYMEHEKKKKYREEEGKEYFKNLDLSAEIVNDGIILPAKSDPTMKKIWCLGGVLDEKGVFIEKTSIRHFYGGAYEYDKDKIQTTKETVIFFGPFVSHWGHFLCDQISRLWYILDNPTKYKIAYCGWNWGAPNTELWGNFLEFFLLLGVREEQLINVCEPTKFERIIIPDNSFIPKDGGVEGYYTLEYKAIINKVISNVICNNIQVPDKVYFTRTRFAGASDKEYGEKEFETIFRSNGYEIVSPEELSLSSQIQYFQNCKYMVALSGTITHNLLFAKDNLNVIILNKMYLLNNYQMIIDRMTNVNITYIDVYKKIFSVCFGLGPFLIGVNKYFNKYVHDSSIKIDRKDRYNIKNKIKKYIWYLKKYMFIYSKPDNKVHLQRQQRKLREGK